MGLNDITEIAGLLFWVAIVVLAFVLLRWLLLASSARSHKVRGQGQHQWDQPEGFQLTSQEEEERLTRILKRVRKIELITRGMVKETLGGAYHSRFKGQGIEFDDFREYQAGDDVRFLDWNVTARMNSPFVRKYIEERELTVMIIADVSGSGDYGSVDDSKRERAAEVAAVFAFSAVQNQDKVALILVSDEVEHYLPARKGSAHALRMIRDILNIRPKSRRTNLTPALELASARLPHRALVLVISDFLTPNYDWEHSLRSLAGRHDVVAVQLSDPREWELPDAGRLSLEDPETGEQRIINTSHPAVRQKYAQRIADHQEAFGHIFKRNAVSRINVRTDEDYAPALKAYFRTRKRRRR